jgi:hypothetical protein
MALSDCRGITSCDRDPDGGHRSHLGILGRGLLLYSWFSTLGGLWEGLPFLEHRGCRSSPRMQRIRAPPIGKEIRFWDTLGFLHLVVLVLHYYDALLLLAPFLRGSSKHSKAQILHPMKTILKPRARRIRSVACNGMRTSAISLLCNCELDTLALWQRDPRLL